MLIKKYIYIYIYKCVCACVCVCVLASCLKESTMQHILVLRHFHTTYRLTLLSQIENLDTDIFVDSVRNQDVGQQ